MNKIDNRPSLISTILKAGLLAGTLDICSAFIYSYIKDVTPERVLQYISKTALGKDTFTDPTVLWVSGLLIHYCIAMGWTIIFFLLYPRLNLIKLNRILTAVIYGLFVWTMMNVVILPIHNHKSFVFKPEGSTVNAIILILAIGMPLSFFAHSFYSRSIKN